MGYMSLTTRLVTTRARHQFLQQLSPGILYSACIIPSDTNARGAQMFAEIGLMEDPPGNDTVVAVLTSGYFGILNRMHWTGSYPLIEPLYIYCNVYGPAAANVRFTWYQLKPPIDTTIFKMVDL